jgi:hypothetical protein
MKKLLSSLCFHQIQLVLLHIGSTTPALAFPSYLHLSRNYFRQGWAFNSHRRLKNLIIVMDWVPDTTATYPGGGDDDDEEEEEEAEGTVEAGAGAGAGDCAGVGAGAGAGDGEGDGDGDGVGGAANSKAGEKPPKMGILASAAASLGNLKPKLGKKKKKKPRRSATKSSWAPRELTPEQEAGLQSAFALFEDAGLGRLDESQLMEVLRSADACVGGDEQRLAVGLYELKCTPDLSVYA